MYHYLEDKEFVRKMKGLSGEIMQSLCHYLKEDYNISANFNLVGSGGNNLILQNENNPIDLDYNLVIVKCKDFADCRYLKECTRKTFNKCLQKHNLRDCEDSTSALTSKLICLNDGNNIKFSIDICITKKDSKDHYHRLIHKKTGCTYNDEYFWNMAPHSEQLKKKVTDIKKYSRWELVRTEYCNIKNIYLSQNDSKHLSSFVCYIESVNNVYNTRNHW